MTDRVFTALKQFCISQGVSKEELDKIKTQSELEKFMISRNLLFDCT